MTIDVGNTRTKWAIFNQANAIVANGVFGNTELGEAPQEWAECALAVISNVAADEMAARLKTMLAPIAHQHWIGALVSGFGIKNGYAQPELLGCDRWAAMVGARQYTEQSCLVVNAGTALTIDAMQREPTTGSHIFVGGVIVPGWRLMQQALYQGTHGINHALAESHSGSDAKAGKYVDLPRNTEDAVYTGALMAMVGAIEQMSLRLQRQAHTGIQCMITGGDALLLAERLRSGAVISDIVMIEDLVLRGLLVIGREIR
ncbi:MAG: type III pantothenate kinase [Nitrosomonadales bacterium]|nr:type III pantothenate kinase [Nitrosomonadales bacterium]